MSRKHLFPALFALLSGILTGSPAWAGPPYFTDDPEPTDYKHWEIYLFTGGIGRNGQVEGSAGVDLNYGAAKDLQLTAVLPADYGGDGGLCTGDVELAAKYKFVHQKDGSAVPDIAFFPRAFLPTSRESRRTQLLLPVWAEKDLGPWSIFGGGGYQLNPGPGNRDYWLEGVSVTRAVTKRLTLGAEIYHQGPDAFDARPFTGINVGASYKLKAPFSLLFSFGPGLQNARSEGRYAFYTALKLDL